MLKDTATAIHVYWRPANSASSSSQVATLHGALASILFAFIGEVSFLFSFVFLIVVEFLFLGTFWWHTRTTIRARELRRKDAEKQRTIYTQGSGRLSDPRVKPTSNPSEYPDSVIYVKKISTMSTPNDRAHGATRPPIYRSESSLITRNAINSLVPARAFIDKTSAMLDHIPSMSTRSGSDSRTISDANSAKHSIMTSSTLPPSYRTDRTTRGIRIHIPEYPPFPPPVYVPTATDEPPTLQKRPLVYGLPGAEPTFAPATKAQSPGERESKSAG